MSTWKVRSGVRSTQSDIVKSVDRTPVLHSRTLYPVAGKPSGAEFSPAGLSGLARPHRKSDPSMYLLSKR